MKKSSVHRVMQAQLDWAQGSGIVVDSDGYCQDLKDNLFEPLSPCSAREINDADGAELGRGGERGKMQALHSSSALVCNIFDYWRGRDLSALGQALGIPGRCCGLAFEQKFRTGLGRIPPNIDVVLHGRDGTTFAIEGKFLEPYRRSKKKNSLKPKYFTGHDGRWQSSGLPACQRLAEGLRDSNIAFKYLDAAQLLKHMLGLASNCQSWRLCYLWFDEASPEAQAHADEIHQFSSLIGEESKHFASCSYQRLFAALAGSVGEEHRRYIDYLRARYFAGGGA